MRQKPYKLDPHTYGGTRGSENLAKILMDYPRFIRKASSQYHKYTTALVNMLSAVEHFKGTGLLQELMILHKKKHFERVKNANYPPLVESHLLNVMNVAYCETLVKVKQYSK